MTMSRLDQTEGVGRTPRLGAFGAEDIDEDEELDDEDWDDDDWDEEDDEGEVGDDDDDQPRSLT